MRGFLNFIFISFFALGGLFLNITWIAFIILLTAKIFHISDIYWFSLNHLSVIGTPIELIVAAVISFFIGFFAKYLN